MFENRRPMDRRTLLKRGMMAASATAAASFSPVEAKQRQKDPSEMVNLREKFFGCIAGCHIGSSMGAAVEGWSWERIQREHGTVDRLLPYEHYGNGWRRLPGTTEDGVERQKLMVTAIIEKQDRVNAEDVRAVWVRDIKPEAPGNVSEPFEGMLLKMAKTSIPAVDIGKYCDYAGLVSLARSCHPIALINAGDVPGAINDVRQVGQLYQTGNSRGIRWAEVTVAAIAAATRPGATVDTVLGAVFDHCDGGVVRELQRGLKLTAECRDFRQMRTAFDRMYSGRGMAYAFSFANEVVTKAVCVLKMTQGNTWEAMKAGVNMGRDTDCLTAVAAGMSGALTGAGSVPEDFIRQVDRATARNKFTNSKRTLRETSDGLYDAFQARLRRLKAYLAEMGTA